MWRVAKCNVIRIRSRFPCCEIYRISILWYRNKGTDAVPHNTTHCEIVQCLEGGICSLNTLRLRQNGRHFADDSCKCMFLNENVWIWLNISLNCVPKVWINNIPALVQIMALRRRGDKPLSEPVMVKSTTLICVTRPQWVKLLVSLRHLADPSAAVLPRCLPNIGTDGKL